LIKSVGKSEHWFCDHKTSRNITCCADMKEIFVWGGGGLVVCRWGELVLGRRRRNKGGEGRHSGHILTFFDGFPLVKPSMILTEKSTRYRTDLPFQILWWFHRHFKRPTDHVTIRAVFLNPSEKITRQNLHVSDPPFFLIRKLFRP
jgi:hypothetical protein